MGPLIDSGYRAAELYISRWRRQFVVTLAGVRTHPVPGEPEASDSIADDQVRLPDPRTDAPPWSTLARNVFRPELGVTASHDVIRLYDGDGRESDRPSTRDLFVFAGAGGTLFGGKRVAIGPVLHVWSTRSAALQGHADGSAFGAMVRAVRFFAPIPAGPDPALAPSITGERRGTRIAAGSLALLHEIAGLLYASIELGGGWSSYESSRRAQVVHGAATGSVFGAELALSSDTPLGPFMIGYGIATTGRGVFKIALGN